MHFEPCHATQICSSRILVQLVQHFASAQHQIQSCLQSKKDMLKAKGMRTKAFVDRLGTSCKYRGDGFHDMQKPRECREIACETLASVVATEFDKCHL